VELFSGRLKEAWNSYRPLKLPSDWKQFAGKIEEQISPMKATAKYLTAAIELNPSDFRIFSPDGRSGTGGIGGGRWDADLWWLCLYQNSLRTSSTSS
jgi:hypothetical protein